MQEKEGNKMILKRKIFVSPDYYKNLNLNEAEEDWLKGKRSGLAKKYNNLRKDTADENKHFEIYDPKKSR